MGNFEYYSAPENFTRIEGGFRFKNSKYVYEFRDSPETIARKKLEFEAGENQRQQERNKLDQEQQRIISLGKQIAKEDSEEKARKRIKEEKEELEKLKSSEINPPASASPTEAPSNEILKPPVGDDKDRIKNQIKKPEDTNDRSD